MDSSSGGSDTERRRISSLPSPNQRRSNRFANTGSATPSSSQVPLDLDSVSFLSSPKKFRQVISSFDLRKREIVESIGFGGLLSIPDISYENKPFTFWLMTKLKWFPESIIVGDRVSLNLTPHSIGSITGLSYSGIDICDDSLETVNEKLSFIKSKLSFLNGDSGIVEAAEKYVQKSMAIVVSKQEVDNFKIAFVIFAMGRFLAPSSEHPDGHTNFWGALQNPDEIKSYNWCSYILSDLLDAARSVEWAIPRRMALTTVAGCTLILQIFYLDNIDFGELNLSHELLPRWKAFSNNSMLAMIKADMVSPLVGSSNTEFGRIKIVRQASRCYNTGKQKSLINTPSIFTPSPPLHPSSKRRSARVSPTSRMTNNEDRRYDSNSDSTIPTIFKSTPSLEPVLDFSAIIRNSFQGEVDDKVLDEFKLYNARCLNHLYKSYRSLAASIVNENANISLKLLENNNCIRNSSKTDAANDLSASRRRRYKDFLSGTDSGTEGEDASMQSKSQRPRLPRFCVASSSAPSTHATVNTFSDIPGSQALQVDVPALDKPAYMVEQNIQASNQTELKDKSLAYTQTPTFCSSKAIVSCDAHLPSVQPHPSIITANHVPTGGFSRRDFQTPDATLKMPQLSPTASPTTENKLFSGAALSVRMLDSMIGIDLNSSSFEEEYNFLLDPKKKAKPGSFALSHWEMKLRHPEIDPLVIKEFYTWLSSTTSNDLDREWINHRIPRSIKITGMSLKEQLVLRRSITFEVMDVSIRRMKQLDKCIYTSDVPYRWRHFLESDYALHVLGAENPVENKPLRDQFVGPDADYELSRCRMFFVPLLVNGTWWCYAWDLKYGVVVIFDPSVGLERDDAVIKKHYGTIEQLATSLTCMVGDLFTGWSPQFTHSKHAVFRLTGIPYSRSDSGLMTLFCIWNFDGNKLAVDCTEAELNKFRAEWLYQLLELNANTGWSPSAYVNIID